MAHLARTIRLAILTIRLPNDAAAAAAAANFVTPLACGTTSPQPTTDNRHEEGGCGARGPRTTMGGLPAMSWYSTQPMAQASDSGVDGEAPEAT